MYRSSGPRRLTSALVAVLIGLAACGDSEAESDGDPSDENAEEGPSEAAEPGVRDPGPTPADAVIRSPIIAIDDQMIALASPAEGSPFADRAIRSTGPGEPWESIELPGAPGPATIDQHDSWTLVREGEVAFISASRSEQGDSVLRVWSSVDGVQWTGGEVGTYPGFAITARPHADGIMTVARQAGGIVIITSADAGGPWESTPLPGVTLSEGQSASLVGGPWSLPDGSVRAVLSFEGQVSSENLAPFDRLLIGASSLSGPWSIVDESCTKSGPEPRGECQPIMGAGDVLVRGVEVSLDGGATWEVAQFSPALKEAPGSVIGGFTAVAPMSDGGFVGTLAGFIPGGGGSLAWVLHSDDGRSWEPLLGPGIDGCEERPQDTAQPWASAEAPVVVGDGALVAHNCPGSAPGVFHIPGEGGAATPVERVSPRQHRVGKPFALAGTVVTPVEHSDSGEVVSLIVVAGQRR